MNNIDSIKHTRGESVFIDDFNVPEGTLHAAVFYSPVAHGIIKHLDISEAGRMTGVQGIYTYKDIPGKNQIGGIIEDENLLAENIVEFIGHPIALVAADDWLTAREAVKKIKVDIEEQIPILDPRTAFEKNSLIMPPRIFSCGDTDSIWSKCDVIAEGRVDSGGQEHLYLETQGAVAVPLEGDCIKIYSATQNPSAVQRTAVAVLNISQNKIECEVLRLGGAFGGKEDQATAWAVLAALAAMKLKRPVKLVLLRHDDMIATGKRHPYSSDFKIGLDKEGKILAYEVTFYQDAGTSADLSPAILDRTLFHAANSYYISNVKATAYSCKTNLTPNTAFRGFGGPQGMFVIESAIYKAAEKMGIEPSVIQEKNLLRENDEFPYGQKAENSNAERCWNEAVRKFDLNSERKKVEEFNSKNKIYKKGFALMPICFGISFTNTPMNRAGALVHIYTDGSIGVSTGAVEMGQGVNMKLRQVAASLFSVGIDKVKTETTNTSRVANTSPTAASSGADLNGKATEIACKNILERLTKTAADILGIENSGSIKFKDEKIYVNGKPSDLNWKNFIIEANTRRVNLSSYAYYATPEIHFDRITNKGKPFAYHVYGTALLEVTLDCIRGNYKINSVKAVHDFGKSMNPVIDRGQAEGAIMQGLGWMTIEEVLHNEKGRLITDTLSTYKVPDIHFTPEELEVVFLENSENPQGIFNSKAIGEPPFMYGIGAYFALLNAMKVFKKDLKYKFDAPMTPEKVLMTMYG
ncbi:MAG TPA: molybdopterin cofactor-binding domain-containing protein [Ignavibacteria bacterium]